MLQDVGGCISPEFIRTMCRKADIKEDYWYVAFFLFFLFIYVCLFAYLIIYLFIYLTFIYCAPFIIMQLNVDL